MSIRHAILGYLSWQPMTGYELKKLFAGSLFIPWSGNNNQIYRTLVQLHDEELVKLEVQQQPSAPPRKIYTTSEKGLHELQQWLMSPPEAPVSKKTFLLQLAWSDLLESSALQGQVDQYEHEVQMRLLMCQEQLRRGQTEPARTARERKLWQAIADNWIATYEMELQWLKDLRALLLEPES